MLDSGAMFWMFRGVLVVGIVLWAANRWLPWSCWLVTLGMTGLWSMHVENTTNTSHIFHMANMLLVLQAIWITADAAEIKQALAGGTFWQSRLVPRWLSLASIAYIGLFHTAAGLSKLWFSGPGWASGTSLQIWTYLWGVLLVADDDGHRRQPHVHAVAASGDAGDRNGRHPRAGAAAAPWIGLGLLGFYAGVLATFDYGFRVQRALHGDLLAAV